MIYFTFEPGPELFEWSLNESFDWSDFKSVSSSSDFSSESGSIPALLAANAINLWWSRSRVPF